MPTTPSESAVNRRSTPDLRPASGARGRSSRWGGALVCLLVVLAGTLRAERIASAPDAIEAGCPAFTISSAESLGFDSAPTDLKRLPDGRILLLAAHQIALGDGVRWQMFRLAPGDGSKPGVGAAVDSDGQIFVGTPAGIARVELVEGAHWRPVVVTPWASPDAAGFSIPEAAVVDTGRHWIWHSLTGPLVSWRPGESPRFLGRADTFEHAFLSSAGLLLSERYGGQLSLLRDSVSQEYAKLGTFSAITCTTPLDSTRLLVGTYNRGVQIFDGGKLQPLARSGLLTGGSRVFDLCATEGGLFAAALDGHGVVFFNQDGRIVQSLDRAFDQRLARVQRLVSAPGGTIWGLLEDGLVRIAFPSGVSRFEPLLSAGLTTAHPFRFGGAVWVLADGRAYRGVYDESRRLTGFTLDGPHLEFINALSEIDGIPVAGTEAGSLFRGPSGWQAFAPDTRGLRVLDLTGPDGRHLYAAQEEIGWLRAVGGRVEIVERIPVPGLSNCFNKPVADRSNALWLELGSGRVARVRVVRGQACAEIFGPEHGAPPSWPQLFAIDGAIAANFADQIHRFDEAQRRFVRDDTFARQFPGVAAVFGRPGLDPAGRVWLTSDGAVRVFGRAGSGWARLPLEVPVAFPPYYFTFEDGGVVWMHAQHRLARFDPAVPLPAAMPLRVQITHVTLARGNRLLLPSENRLPPLEYRDNSLVVSFLAPGSSFSTPATFETQLQGAGADWTSVGSSGTATFNNLKEGGYTLRIRARAGELSGEPASLVFTIRPPWFRTPLAYACYLFGAGALVYALAAGWSFLARRDRSRLEQLVSQRTAQLRGSEERYRILATELERRVADRTIELEGANQLLLDANRELESFSYSVSHDLRSPLRNISGFASLLQQRIAKVVDPESMRFLGIVANEAIRLSQLIDSLLSFSRLGRAELKEGAVDLQALVEAARNDLRAEQDGREIEWRIDPLPLVRGDPTLLRQVFANLLGNALKFSRGRNPAIITVGVIDEAGTPSQRTLFVRDNGAGFDPKYSANLFGVFQRLHSAKEFEGTGIGLANVRRIVARHGGRVWAEGVPGQGATFYFTLPTAAQAAGPSPGRS